VSSSIRRFKVVAVAEAVSYLVLLGASVAKHVFDVPGGVTLMGPIHGVVFLAFLWLALLVREELGWELVTTLTVIVAAVVPLGGLWVERRVAADARSAAQVAPARVGTFSS
jgi:integral membrane protein